MTLAQPIFFETDPAAIIADMKAFYQTTTGKILQPAQPEMLIINAFAYRELLIRQQANNASLQNLVAFAVAPVLDYLGQLVAVTRLAATGAITTLEYTFVAGQGGVTVPAGNRVASKDGAFVFTTLQDLSVDANIAQVAAIVPALCQILGQSGNNYAPGDISEMLDPLAFVVSVANTTLTAGGSDDETDDELRSRIMLAPDSFSDAGSEGAYIFFAKTASALIIDVKVVSLHPGEVDIYPLISGGAVTPTEILDAVAAICSADKVRPLTDTVNVYAPTQETYSITASLILYDTADQPSTIAAVQSALQAFSSIRASKLGMDIIVDQAKAAAYAIPGVYKVTFSDLLADIIIADTQYGFCTAVSVNVTSTIHD